ncbi:universal stress protein [Hymenobacter monticola]|uniref:Universal stress protein n=1 Tax=Hymenobacter monticola TaxID=1705399 RepID=A0ABY4AZ79_9BACT|nr:universal stress protein [Hymenobacter monticola]UOE32210.1 universal stress protein [Hymenobacter monticola]
MKPSLLILTDFFPAANKALDYATCLAEPLKARLVLLHVRRDSLLDPEMFTGASAHESPQAATLALRSAARQTTVPLEAEVGHGQVAPAAAEAVREHHPLLVVLGRPDYSDTPDELVQTASLDLLRHAPYPMLVVPHGVAGARPPRRVLLAVDGEPFSLGDHQAAAHHILTALGAEVTVFHAVPTTGPNELPPLVLDSVLRTGLTLGLSAVQCHSVVSAHPATAILEAAQSGAYDLVVLMARRRSFMGRLFHRSVTAQVLVASPLPVLVLPAG